MKEAIANKVEVDLVTQIRAIDGLLDNQWELTPRQYTSLLREQNDLIDEFAALQGRTNHAWRV